MAEFSPAPDGVRLCLDTVETELLRQLTEEFRTLLSGDRGDAVFDRLFPSAYEDPSDEAKYRDLIGDDLERHKLEAVDVVRGSLGKRRTEATIEGESFESWIQCLTDLRLAIGVRLDVDEATMERDIDPGHPDAQPMFVLHWLGFVQQGLIEARGTIAGP
jgi:hypothetical protein